MTNIGERVAQILNEQLEELEGLAAAGKAPQDYTTKTEAIRELLALRESRFPAAPKKYGKVRPVLADFDRSADKWGNS